MVQATCGEPGRAAGENAGKMSTANDTRAQDLNDDMGISAHGRVHVRVNEDKLVEPCQIGRGKVTVARMRDLSAGFQSFSGAHTF